MPVVYEVSVATCAAFKLSTRTASTRPIQSVTIRSSNTYGDLVIQRDRQVQSVHAYRHIDDTIDTFCHQKVNQLKFSFMVRTGIAYNRRIPIFSQFIDDYRDRMRNVYIPDFRNDDANSIGFIGFEAACEFIDGEI